MFKYFQYIFIFLLVIVSFNFFESRFLNKTIVYYLPFFYILVAIVLSVPHFFSKREGFVLPVQLIILGIFLSIPMAYISWEQGFIDTILSTIPYLLWIFFFYLLKIKFPVSKIEGILLVYSIIYIVLFFIQLKYSDSVLFGGSSEILKERGTTRVIVPGQGIFLLASFLSINNLTSGKSGKVKWILLSIIGILIPFLQATRQMIIGVVIIYLYHFLRTLPLYQKGILLMSVFSLSFYLYISDNEIIMGLIDTHKKTVQEGKNYARVVTGTYFLTEFSPNRLSQIFGNGVPSTRQTSYHRNIYDLRDSGIDMSDVGLIGFYALFGIIPIIAYLMLWLNSFRYSLPSEFIYTKYYLWMLLLTSLTSDFTYSNSYLISTIFVLYIFQKNIVKKTV